MHRVRVAGLGFLRERDVVLGVTMTGLVEFAEILEARDCCVAYQPEHADARLAREALGDAHHADVGERFDRRQRVSDRPFTREHRSDRGQVSAAGEDAETVEAMSMVRGQEVDAPSNRGREGALASGPVALPRRERESLLDALRQRLGTEQAHLRSRELDGEREPLEPGADRDDV